MPELRKIWLDSRARYSGSHSSFSIELPETLECPDGWSMWVHSVSFAHAWRTIEEANRNLWILETYAPVTHTRQVQLPVGNYTLTELAAALESALNGAGAIMTYTVRLGADSVLEIEVNRGDFRFPSRRELTMLSWKQYIWDAYPGVSYNISDPGSFVDMLSLPQESAWQSVLVTGVVNLRAIQSCYLHSNLTKWSNMMWDGRRDCIARIPITVDYGFTQQFTAQGFPEDAVDVSNLRVKNMTFSLRDAYGRPLQLRGTHVTIELIFGPSK